MTAPAVLEAQGLGVRLGGIAVVHDVSLALRPGALVALIGPNGAGKTTLIRALAGLIAAEGGIALDGRPLAILPLRERARRIAYLPQGNVFHWPLSVEAMVALGRYPHGDPFAPPSPADREAVAKALAATGMQAFAQRPVTTLSGGEKARAALARALATQAGVLLADEPTVSLDPRHQLVVMELLREAAHAGAAVLAVVHDLALAARYADRIVALERGRIALDGPAAEVMASERLGEIFGVEIARVAAGDIVLPIPQRPR